MHTDIQRIIELWKQDAGLKYRNPVVIHIDDKNLWVITERPGWMIGRHGDLVDRYKEILKENGYNLRIRFVEFGHRDVDEF